LAFAALNNPALLNAGSSASLLEQLINANMSMSMGMNSNPNMNANTINVNGPFGMAGPTSGLLSGNNITSPATFFASPPFQSMVPQPPLPFGMQNAVPFSHGGSNFAGALSSTQSVSPFNGSI